MLSPIHYCPKRKTKSNKNINPDPETLVALVSPYLNGIGDLAGGQNNMKFLINYAERRSLKKEFNNYLAFMIKKR
jgi:hypothetical protein